MRKFLSMLFAFMATASLAFAASQSESETVNCGGSATLTASEKTGYHFVEWQKGGVQVSTENPYQVTNIQEDASYTAIFAPNTNTAYTLKHWQQNLADDEYTEVVGDREDKTGTTGTNTAAAAKSYTGFTAQAFSQQTIAANGSTVINIYYNRETYTINFYKDSPANAGNKIAGFGGTFKYGATVTAPVAGTDFPVKAETAQYTYAFDSWSETFSATVTASVDYVAQWAATTRSYTITFVNYNGAQLEQKSVEYGTIPTYTGATPEKTGSTWTGWTPAIVEVTGEATYTATFDADNYAITVNKEGSGTVIGGGSYTYGATPTITATAADCYIFKGWKKDGGSSYVSTSASYTLPAITSVATYTAVFELATYTITATSDDSSQGTVTVTLP